MRAIFALVPCLLLACGGEDDTEPVDSDTDVTAECPIDLCDTYGAAVPTVAANITDAAATDPRFSADFAPLVARGPAAVTAFKTSLANFISDAYGCTTGAYTGPNMTAVHTGLGITQTEYDDFIGLIATELTEAGVPDEHINLCFAPPLVDPAFANTMIGK